MFDEPCQITTGLRSVVGHQVRLHGLQLTIEASLDALWQQVEVVDQGYRVGHMRRGPVDHHLEAAAHFVAHRVAGATVHRRRADGEGDAGSGRTADRQITRRVIRVGCCNGIVHARPL